MESPRISRRRLLPGEIKGPLKPGPQVYQQFHQPVYVGDLVSCYAEVAKTGRTSLTIFVEVFAERRRGSEECIKVTEATLTYVAIDESGRPRPVK